MVNYDNPDLFYDHDTTHLIIVNSSATVTGRSNTTPLITNDNYCITEDNITEDEFELREALCSRDNLKFGVLESACFMVDIFDSDTIPYLKDESIDVYIYFDDDSSTLFKVGRYIVNSDAFSDDRLVRSITAYDMINYLRDYDITAWYDDVYEGATTRTIKYLRDSLFTWLNTDIEDYNITQEETNLVNDDWLVEKSINSDKITFGFWMERIAEANGVFPHINRQGVFCYVGMKWYDQPAVKTFDDELTIPPVKFGGSDKDITVWGIAYVYAYDGNNKFLGKAGSTNKKHPSNYYIVDSFVFTNNRKQSGWKASLETALGKLRNAITHLRYKPFEGGFYGNLCYEVGDRIDVEITDYDEEDDDIDDDIPIVKSFYTYILERTFVGLNDFEDTYSARGDKKQPRYKLKGDKWSVTDTDTATAGIGTSGVAELKDPRLDDFIEYLRNVGIRLLDEPDAEVVYNKDDAQVEITWTDPADITTKRPEKAEWLGTVVVRKENSAPKHRWDGELIVNSTTRDEYSEEPLIDNTIQPNKRYYYGIFPYYRHLSDADNNVNFYRFTKVFSVNTESFVVAPTITSLLANGSVVTMNYTIPTLDVGTYTECIVVYKKGNIPTSKTDGTSVTLDPTETTKVISGLDDSSIYYFIIYTTDSNGNTAESDVDSIGTGDAQIFTYTGDIQTFTAPKTGIYSLETWGAQGGNVNDGTDSARGGFGAYAYGEVLLYEGDTVYVNVGGQNGYGGGGNYTPPNNG